MTKSPTIHTNEGTAPKKVRIMAHVVTRPDSTYPLIMKPYKVDISQFGDKVRDEMKFTISNVSQTDLDIELIDFPAGLVELDMPDGVGADSEAEVTLKLKPEAVEQSFSRSMTIQVNDEENTRFTIPIHRSLRTPGRTTASTQKGVTKK